MYSHVATQQYVQARLGQIMCISIFHGVKTGDCTDSRTMQQVLDLCNETVSEKTLQIFWPSVPVEYMTSTSGWTDAPDMRCGLTDRQTDRQTDRHTHTRTHTHAHTHTHTQTNPTTVTLAAHACRGSTSSDTGIHSTACMCYSIAVQHGCRDTPTSHCLTFLARCTYISAPHEKLMSLKKAEKRGKKRKINFEKKDERRKTRYSKQCNSVWHSYKLDVNT